MNFDTRDKIGRWIMGISTGAFILSVVLIVGLLFSDKTGHPFDYPLWFADEPEITVTGEYDDITFLEMEKLLLSTKEMTSLQTQNLTQRWEGQRVIWDGFVTDIGNHRPVVIVSLNPRPRRDGLEHIGGVWVQAHFDTKHLSVLLLLRKGQALRVSCEFDEIFGQNTPILVDCHIVEVEGLIGPPAPFCDDDDINCHPETAPNLEGTVS